ncbi:MAG: hypothetical protein M3132_05270 [Actinomycetia bacterium]|nr:hypothetical protein [Actinomycetes bacterium]
MLLRIVLALGGLTLLGTGIGILFSDTCEAVLWGSRGRTGVGNFTATCQDVVSSGTMSSGVAAFIAIAAGIAVLVLVAIGPILANARDRSTV